MGIGIEDIYNVLRSLVEDLKRDFIEVQKDPLISTRREVFYKYYKVENIEGTRGRGRIAFVDAGFKPYQLDVSIIIPLQIGGLVRDEDGKLHKIREILDKPIYDFILLYSNRRNIGGQYVFTVKIKPFHENTLLFETRRDAEDATNRINKLLKDIEGLDRSRQPQFFVKLTKYIEGLLELSYSIKLLRTLEENIGLSPEYVVLDGTLIKWFSIGRTKLGFDGLDILSAILDMDPKEIRGYLFKIIGLSKTTKFTNIIRSQGLFHVKKPRIINGRGFYSLVDLEGVDEIPDLLGGYMENNKKFVSETIKILNRIVYSRHNIYVARFPLTTDHRNIFMLDIHLEKPVISLQRDKIVIDKEYASSINPYITYIVNTMLYHRTRITGEPPYGYMEIDHIVRMRDETRRFIEESLVRVLRSSDDLTSKILEQVFSPTTRMRYGYR